MDAFRFKPTVVTPYKNEIILCRDDRGELYIEFKINGDRAAGKYGMLDLEDADHVLRFGSAHLTDGKYVEIKGGDPSPKIHNIVGAKHGINKVTLGNWGQSKWIDGNSLNNRKRNLYYFNPPGSVATATVKAADYSDAPVLQYFPRFSSYFGITRSYKDSQKVEDEYKVANDHGYAYLVSDTSQQSAHCSTSLVLSPPIQRRLISRHIQDIPVQEVEFEIKFVCSDEEEPCCLISASSQQPRLITRTQISTQNNECETPFCCSASLSSQQPLSITKTTISAETRECEKKTEQPDIKKEQVSKNNGVYWVSDNNYKCVFEGRIIASGNIKYCDSVLKSVQAHILSEFDVDNMYPNALPISTWEFDSETIIFINSKKVSNVGVVGIFPTNTGWKSTLTLDLGTYKSLEEALHFQNLARLMLNLNSNTDPAAMWSKSDIDKINKILKEN